MFFFYCYFSKENVGHRSSQLESSTPTFILKPIYFEKRFYLQVISNLHRGIKWECYIRMCENRRYGLNIYANFAHHCGEGMFKHMSGEPWQHTRILQVLHLKKLTVTVAHNPLQRFIKDMLQTALNCPEC